MEEGKLIEREKKIIDVKLEYMKYRYQTVLSVRNKVLWSSVILSIGFLGIIMNYLRTQEISLNLFLGYGIMFIGFSIVLFMFLLYLWAKPLQNLIDENEKLTKDLINNIKTGKL